MEPLVSGISTPMMLPLYADNQAMVSRERSLRFHISVSLMLCLTSGATGRRALSMNVDMTRMTNSTSAI